MFYVVFIFCMVLRQSFVKILEECSQQKQVQKGFDIGCYGLFFCFFFFGYFVCVMLRLFYLDDSVDLDDIGDSEYYYEDENER